jgi:divalent metal cation (Fe/Co/Zn/Cd) transporter
LLIANRRSRRPPDIAHPFGHGREAYVWSLLAAVGLFVAGAAVSVTHGIQELIRPEPASNFVVGYAVLGVSRSRGNLVPAVGPAGQTGGAVVAA